MATIEIYSPSSHSQTVDTPATIVAEASVLNTGSWGYAQMIISGEVTGSGSITACRPGVNTNVRATHLLNNSYQGRTLIVSAYLYEVTQGGSVIKSITSPHNNFRIYVKQPWVPPPVQPWPPWNGEE